MQKSQKKKLIIIFIVMSILGLTCVFNAAINIAFKKFCFDQNIVSRKDNLIVHFISVGQGDAVAINLPDDKIVLIDSGTEDYSVEYTDYMYDKVLSNSKDKYIDYLILTHADKDHFGGTKRLIQDFKLKNMVTPFLEEDKDEYKDLMLDVKNKNINVTNVTDIENIIGREYLITFYYIEANETNSSSTVVKLSYNGTNFLFAGDIDTDTEKNLIDLYAKELDCDVLKVAHHGSKNSTSNEFLEVVTPKHAVISCAKNSYGHPTDTVLKNLSNVGAEIYRTDADGNLMFVVDEDLGLKVSKNDMHLISFEFNYAIFILIIEVCIIFTLFVRFLMVLLKKYRRNKLLEKK